MSNTLNAIRLIRRIKHEEGFRAKAFWDSAVGSSQGQYTNGYGTRAFNKTEVINEEVAEFRCKKVLNDRIKNYLEIFNTRLKLINEVRAEAIIQMMYVLGVTGFLGFKQFNMNLNKRDIDWSQVARELFDSIWREQMDRVNSGRVLRLFVELTLGEYYFSEKEIENLSIQIIK